MYIDKLDETGNKCNNTLITIKPVDVTSGTYIDFVIENDEKDPKFKVGDHVRISKYKNILAKCFF